MPKLSDMPLDWHALMNDEKVIAMTNEQLGIYMRLLYRAWFSDEPASLPANDSILASIAQVSAERWSEVKSAVLAPWRLRGERIVQKKMLAVHNAVLAKLKTRSESGKLGACKRWSNNELHSDAIHLPMAKHSNLNLKRNRKVQRSDKASQVLSASEKEIAESAEAILGDQWPNDAGKWIKRIRTNPGKCWRLFAEVENAQREDRINSTPAQYAEHLWTEFQ